MPETVTNLPFPTGGVEVSTEHATQPPLTTPSAANVRSFDPALDRLRGGSRAGLSRHINQRVSGANLIQHINYIVDPQTQALPDYDPPGGGDDGDPDSPGPTGGFNPLGGGPDGDGTYLDPTEEDRNPTRRRVRYGGSGSQTTKKRKLRSVVFRQATPSLPFQLVSYPAFTPLAPFGMDVVQGNLLVVIAVTGSGDRTVAVTDTLGNVYGQSGGYVASGTGERISLWYCLSGSGGANTVTVTPSGATSVASMCLEYRNVSPVPEDGVGTNIEAGSSANWTTGTVAVNNYGDVIVAGFFVTGSGPFLTAFTPTTGVKQRTGMNDFTAIACDRLPISTNSSVSGTANVASSYIAIATSFFRLPPTP